MWTCLSLDTWLDHNFIVLNWTENLFDLGYSLGSFFLNLLEICTLVYDSQLEKIFFSFSHFLFILLFLSSIVAFPLSSEFLSFLSYRHWCSLHWPSERWALPQLKTKSISLLSYILTSNSLELIPPPQNFHQLNYILLALLLHVWMFYK